MEGFMVEFWHWWVAGLLLATLEVFAPGVVFIWLGLAAGVVGVLLWALPDLAWEYQISAFAVLSVVAVVLARLYLRRRPLQTDRPLLNRRGEQYVGRRLTLEQAIVNGTGWVRVDDSRWKVTGPDLPAGTTVKVVAVDGVVLSIEAA
ncbi:NfeD family protein [Endothiovibrio diazotrophicus]